MIPEIVNLRAEVAMRAEDHRIARKHEDEAAARPATAENVRAYARAVRWSAHRAEQEREARARLIQFVQQHPEEV